MPHHRLLTIIRSQVRVRGPRLALLAVATVGVLQIGGCYYFQAASGQMEILRKRTPISEVIEDAGSSAQLRQRLAMVQEARQFAVAELLLPDNESYRTFVDLERDYVVWNVIAAPEFSLRAKTWCYPIVGCVAYRGYFSEKAAKKHAEKLRAKDYDVFVGGVIAYSTLGRFADPVLNTMMRWSDTELVSVLFHELAHQRLFIKGETGFNESFATAVAEIGVEHWLRSHGKQAEIEAYQGRGNLRQTLMLLVDAAKTELDALYAAADDNDRKREKKHAILARLSSDAEQVVQQQSFAATNWLRPPINNARLASLVLYRGQLDTFRDLFERCNRELTCFYRAAEELAQARAH
ncbi:MAG: aminopeptidase [Proteobacteria bacterium]|nr:aminopeptidase [Pseudomonadota bacterium]